MEAPNLITGQAQPVTTQTSQPAATNYRESGLVPWNKGDLVVYDNRSLIHSATWYDAENHQRLMWRTTVHGNPGPLYDSEEKSWIA